MISEKNVCLLINFYSLPTGQPCDMDEDFEAILDPSYGNCYTFTGKKTVGNSSIGSGPHGGLSLILFLEATVYGSATYDGLYNRYKLYFVLKG